MIYNVTETNFYRGLLEWDCIKVINLTLNVVITLVGPVLLYSVVWYERFSADLLYRTLINQLLSHLCRMEIVICLSTRITYFVNYCFSPLPLPVCDATMFIGRVTFIIMITQMTIRQFIKYLYIFNWKSIASLNDNFSAAFITAVNVGFCFVFAFVAYFLGFHNEEPGAFRMYV